MTSVDDDGDGLFLLVLDDWDGWCGIRSTMGPEFVHKQPTIVSLGRNPPNPRGTPGACPIMRSPEWYWLCRCALVSTEKLLIRWWLDAERFGHTRPKESSGSSCVRDCDNMTGGVSHSPGSSFQSGRWIEGGTLKKGFWWPRVAGRRHTTLWKWIVKYAI